MRLKIRSVVVIALAAVALGVSLQAAETKYGAGVTLTSATPIKDLYASPDKFVGKTVRVDGVVTAVCTEMGCWLAIGATDNPDQAVRFQADHDGKIVFPISLKGQKASAEGVGLLLWMSGLWLIAARFAWKGVDGKRSFTPRSTSTSIPAPAPAPASTLAPASTQVRAVFAPA